MSAINHSTGFRASALPLHYHALRAAHLRLLRVSMSGDLSAWLAEISNFSFACGAFRKAEYFRLRCAVDAAEGGGA